jgi:hypothetical protein
MQRLHQSNSFIQVYLKSSQILYRVSPGRRAYAQVNQIHHAVDLSYN